MNAKLNILGAFRSEYSVKPTRLREQANWNSKRFQDDFMFQHSDKETDFLLSQNAIPSRKVLGGSLPYVFTEQGVANLSSVLTSDKASEVNIQIMRAFVEIRRFIQNNVLLFQRLDEVETRQCQYELETDRKSKQIFKALENGEELPKQRIFFNGQLFDAYRFISYLIRSARKSIILIHKLRPIIIYLTYLRT